MQKLTVLAILAFTLPGCLLISVNETADKEVVYVPAPSATTAPASARDLEARYHAAMQISVFTQRDAALARVATDSADAGNVFIARKALAGMNVFTARDQAAEEVAMRLAARNLRAEAIEVARTIDVFTVRDRVLGKLATP